MRHDRRTCQSQTEQALNILLADHLKFGAHTLMQHKVVCSKAGQQLSTNQCHSRSPIDCLNGRAKGMSIILTNPDHHELESEFIMIEPRATLTRLA